jgi:hypothetical protein
MLAGLASGSFKRAFVTLLLLLLLLVASCTALHRYLREQSCSMLCKANLAQIGLALLNYHQIHGSFPPAYLCDRAGKPVNSWRTEVIPSFWYNFRPGRDDYPGGEGYNYTEPWNGPKNIGMHLDRTRCWEFQCPSDRNNEPAVTDYVAVVGPNTMWPGCTAAKPAVDGSDNDKILVIEVIHSDILWMEPRDLTLEQALDAIQPQTGMGIGSHHRDGIHYVTVGGAVRTLPRNVDRESLRRLLVRGLIQSPSKREHSTDKRN